MIVQQKVFYNEPEHKVNEFLSKIPAENIISTHYGVHGYEGTTDEFTTIFYKVEEAPQ